MSSGGGKVPSVSPALLRREAEQKALEEAQKAKAAADIKAAAQNVQGLDSNGVPIAPKWQSLLDSNEKFLRSPYKLGDWKDVNANTNAYDMYSKTALRDAGTNSAWANLMLDQQKLDQTNQADQSARLQKNGANSVLSKLAQTGGYTGGSRERALQNAELQGLLQRQNVSRQGSLDRMNIRTQDESQRMQGLQNLQGMNQQIADNSFKNQSMQQDVNKTNLGTLLGQVRDKRIFDSTTYEQKMKAWAAGKTADAQSGAAGGGGDGTSFICTALRSHGLMNKREAKLMTKFMLGAIASRADFFAWYFTNGKKAVEKAQSVNFDFSKIKQAFVDDILATLETSEVKAQNEYIEKTGMFCEAMLGFCGYKPEMATRGVLKSLVKLPQVFILKSTWIWAYNYLTPRVKKKTHQIAQRADLWVNRLKLIKGE